MYTGLILQNTIQEYAWGSHTAIPDLLGTPSPSENPQAELWMGAHPKAPSLVRTDDGLSPLDELIRLEPDAILGGELSARFDGKLPFLFKVLAAAEPLSIQAHPTLEQAGEGYARENNLGIPLDAPNRNYKDDNHKPEILCALTPFWVLNGFRKIDRIVELLQQIGPEELIGEIRTLATEQDSGGLKRFFSAIMTMDKDRQARAVWQTVAYAAGQSQDDPLWSWIATLDNKYPGDIGVLSPVLLNLLKMEPGQAMLCEAGQLHAYLDGLGIELMANSDNVLRGGLTPKHVDVPELLNTLTFEKKEVKLYRPDDRGNYPSESDEFLLSVISIDADHPFESAKHRNVEILICTSGRGAVHGAGTGEIIPFEKGVSFIVSSISPPYRLEGEATLYRAS
ncbi:MAG: mannose-6-phosphate isomerase, class I, partial [Candidatus Krumholzibacteria bacterium]|nr:mannose-6-phosphate isomerase, class I [Candidatus Krumholzibacteria bacterium]